MANYSLVVDSTFLPFSFERYLLPLLIYGLAYREQELALSELNTKASIWEKMANELTDQKAYAMYKKYSDDLNKAASELATKGLSHISRKNMLDLKARYSSEITPIELAFLNRAEEMKELQAGKSKGIVYEGLASNSSLDRYLDNPAIRYGLANALEGFLRVASAASAISKLLMTYSRGQKLDPYMNTWLLQHGYRADEANLAITDIQNALLGKGNVRGNNVLLSILANEMLTAGVNNWNDAAKLDYYNRIAPAIYLAVGLTQVLTFENFGAKESLRHAHAMAEAALSNPNLTGNNAPIKVNDPNMTDLYSKSEIALRNKLYTDLYKEFRKSGYITEAGLLTRAGLREYKRLLDKGTRSNMDRDELIATSAAPKSYQRTKFYNFLHSLGYTPTGNGRNDLLLINNILKKTRHNIISGAPVGDINIKVSRTYLTPEQSKDVASLISPLIGNVGILPRATRVVETPNGEFKVKIEDSTNNGLTYDDLASLAKDGSIAGRGRIVYINNSHTSNLQLIQLSNGEMFVLPKLVFSNSAIANINAANLAVTLAKNAKEAAVAANHSNTYITSLLNENKGQDTKWPESDKVVVY